MTADNHASGGVIHVVGDGDSVPSLAFEHGLYWRTLWEHPRNASLKRRRCNPNVLQPGDEIFIPATREREVEAATGRRHVFRRLGVPSVLRLRFVERAPAPSREKLTASLVARFAADREASAPSSRPTPGPWADVAFTLEIDSVRSSGTTDADGVVELVIPPDARAGMLVLAQGEPCERRVQLKLGQMDPVACDRGVRQRLQNLGYLPCAKDEPASEVLSNALIRFQDSVQIPATGEPDQATRDQLVAAYGS